MLQRALRLLAGLVLLAIFGIAGYWSVRMAWADHPNDADAHLRLAALAGQKGADPRPELRRAAALKPDDYRIWMRLAVENEARGDPASAERCLLRAAGASRHFEPRWRLTNYYFRRRDTEQFWRWARDALPMAYGDPTPLFRLCRQMPAADEGIERFLPDKPGVLAAYLQFLIAEKDPAGAERVARRLLPMARSADLPQLLSYCDRELASFRGESALRIWNGLRERGLVPYPAGFLTNGDFAREPTDAGFDWRMESSLPGVTAVRMGAGGGLRITFSGKEPEVCELLQQWLPPGGSDRRLRVEYRTAGIAPSSGLRWTVMDAATGKEIAGVPLSSDSWNWAEVQFPPRLARIVLSYRRAPGTVRIEGALEIRRAQT